MFIIRWIIVGPIAGFLTGKRMKGSGFGTLMDIVGASSCARWALPAKAGCSIPFWSLHSSGHSNAASSTCQRGTQTKPLTPLHPSTYHSCTHEEIT